MLLLHALLSTFAGLISHAVCMTSHADVTLSPKLLGLHVTCPEEPPAGLPSCRTMSFGFHGFLLG